MTALTKPVTRTVTIRSSDPAIADSVWAITMSPHGLSIRRQGAAKASARAVTWRTVLGIVLAGGA